MPENSKQEDQEESKVPKEAVGANAAVIEESKGAEQRDIDQNNQN